MSNELRTGAGTGNVVYAHVINPASRRWNGTTFEAYASANYTNYDVTMTEQGSSGVYVGDFPSGITDDATFEIFYYIAVNGTPAEGDPVAGIGSVDWDGSGVTDAESTVDGEMDIDEWVDYIVRTFIRTDKTTEIYDATNEAIAEIRRKIRTSREETETSSTDTIATLGEYKIDLETNHGMFVSDVFIRDSGNGYYLKPISKSMFDYKFSKWGTGSSERGRPREYTVYGGQVYVGPIPDSIAYTYVFSYTKENYGAVSGATTSVPFTKLDYREILKNGVLFRVYGLVENDDQAGKYKAFWDQGLSEIDNKERRNRREVTATCYRDL